MNTLYHIIKSLQSTQGSLAKSTLIEKHKESTLLQAFLKATYDPSISFYQKRAPQTSKVGSCELAAINISNIVFMLNERKVTGKAAVEWLQEFMEEFTQESQELISLMISRSVGAEPWIILAVWPDLFDLHQF